MLYKLVWFYIVACVGFYFVSIYLFISRLVYIVSETLLQLKPWQNYMEPRKVDMAQSLNVWDMMLNMFIYLRGNIV